MKNNNIIHSWSWGWGTHTKVGFRAYIGRTEMGIYGWVYGNGMTDGLKIEEGFLLLYLLVNFAMKTRYVWQGVVVAISWWICDVKIAANLGYVCQDIKK